MSEIQAELSSDWTRLWTFLEAELLKENAFLLPLRLFIGLGWLRASVEKIIEPAWRSGDALVAFFQGQMAADFVYFPFYETLITQVFEPNALALSWIIIIGELLAGIAIAAGIFTNLALLSGMFMNLNFILAGVVNPSAFYIVIQAALLSGNAGATMSVDSMMPPEDGSISAESTTASWRKWSLLLSGGLCAISAVFVMQYIRDFGPHSVDDPAMLLFILLSLGAMLLGIHFVRASVKETRLHT